MCNNTGESQIEEETECQVILLDRVIRRPGLRTDWFTHLVLEELSVASIAVCC